MLEKEVLDLRVLIEEKSLMIFEKIVLMSINYHFVLHETLKSFDQITYILSIWLAPEAFKILLG